MHWDCIWYFVFTISLLFVCRISKNPSNIDQNIGYCPQFDALDHMLTGMETLAFFAKIKGIPDENIKEVILIFLMGNVNDIAPLYKDMVYTCKSHHIHYLMCSELNNR